MIKSWEGEKKFHRRGVTSFRLINNWGQTVQEKKLFAGKLYLEQTSLKSHCDETYIFMKVVFDIIIDVFLLWSDRLMEIHNHKKYTGTKFVVGGEGCTNVPNKQKKINI